MVSSSIVTYGNASSVISRCESAKCEGRRRAGSRSSVEWTQQCTWNGSPTVAVAVAMALAVAPTAAVAEATANIAID